MAPAAVQSPFADLPPDVKDLFLSRLLLRDLVCWGSTCKLNARDIDRALERELRVTVADVLGHAPAWTREPSACERAVKRFFIEFLPKRALIITKVDFDWVCSSQAMVVSNTSPICGRDIFDYVCYEEVCERRNDAATPLDAVCCGCKEWLCLAGERDYPSLPNATEVRLRSDRSLENVPLWMFPNVKHLYLELACCGRQKLGEAPWAKLEVVTVCGAFGGHVPTQLGALKQSPLLREVTLLLNVDGFGSVSFLGDLKNLGNAHHLTIGTNPALTIRDRAKVIQQTVTNSYRGATIDGFLAEHPRRPRPVISKVTLLLPKLCTEDVAEYGAEFAQAARDVVGRGWEVVEV